MVMNTAVPEVTHSEPKVFSIVRRAAELSNSNIQTENAAVNARLDPEIILFSLYDDYDIG